LGTRGHRFGFGEASSALPFGLASFTALGFILEILVVEEVLFSRREYEIRSTIYALEHSILKLRHNRFPVVDLTLYVV